MNLSWSGWQIELFEQMDEEWSATPIGQGHQIKAIPPAAAVLVKMVGIWYVRLQVTFPTSIDVDCILGLESNFWSNRPNPLTPRHRSMRC